MTQLDIPSHEGRMEMPLVPSENLLPNIRESILDSVSADRFFEVDQNGNPTFLVNESARAVHLNLLLIQARDYKLLSFDCRSSNGCLQYAVYCPLFKDLAEANRTRQEVNDLTDPRGNQ